MLQVFEYNITKKNSNRSNLSSLISSGVAIEDDFLNHGVISSMDVHVLKKKLFLSFPNSYDVVSQPLNAWKNRNAKYLSAPKFLAIWGIGMNLSYFPAPNSIQSSFKGTS